MIPVVEVAKDHEFKQQSKEESCRERQHQGDEKISDERVESDREIRAQHVLDAVREVDEVHHPEHQRKTGRDQEKQDAELETVQNLDNDEARGHCTGPAPFLISSGNLWRADPRNL